MPTNPATFVARSLIAVAPMLALWPIAATAEVIIGRVETANMSCSGGVCQPTAVDAALSTEDLYNLLQSGNATVTTHGAGGIEAGNLKVTGYIQWTTPSTLTLTAYRSIVLQKLIEVGGAGSLTLTDNDGGQGGQITFRQDYAKDHYGYGALGRVYFKSLSSRLTINASPYTIVATLPALAAAIAANPSGSFALSTDTYDAHRDGTYAMAAIPTPLTGVVDGLGNRISYFKLQSNCPKDQSCALGLFALVRGSVRNLFLSDVSVTDVANATSYSYIGAVAGMVDPSGSLFNVHAFGTVGCGGPMRCDAGGIAGYSRGQISASDAYVTVSGNEAGGLVGIVQKLPGAVATVTDSHAGGAVGGPGGLSAAGGLIGETFDAVVARSYATASVTGGDYLAVGGLVGASRGSIQDCYATGNVSGSGDAYVGGLVGNPTHARIATSYVTDTVSTTQGSQRNVGAVVGRAGKATFEDVYWTTDTGSPPTAAGGGTPAGITGLTTSQLRSSLPLGFNPAFWHAGDTPYYSYPYLRLER